MCQGGPLRAYNAWAGVAGRGAQTGSRSTRGNALYCHRHPHLAIARCNALGVERCTDCLECRTGLAHCADTIPYSRFARLLAVQLPAFALAGSSTQARLTGFELEENHGAVVFGDRPHDLAQELACWVV